MNRTLALCVLLGCGGSPSPSASTPTTTEPSVTVEDTPAEETAQMIAAADVVVDGGLPLLPRGLTSFGLAEHEGALYLLGGFFGEPHRYVAEDQSAALYVLRPGMREWEEGPGLDRGMQSVALVNVQNALHRIGGMQVRDGGLHSVAEHARLDPAAGRWTTLPALPEPRSSHDAIAHGDSLWVVGGWRLSGAPREGTFAETALRFDGETWHATPAPLRRRALGLAATENHLVAVGGLAAEGVSQQVDILDVSTGEWSRGPDLPGNRTGFGIAVVGVGDSVYASGFDGVLRRLRVGADAWEDVGTIAFPRFFHRMVHVDGGFAVVGGIGGMHTSGRTRVVETVPDSGGGALTIAVPWDAEAKNRQGTFLAGDHLYFFGGNNSLGQHDFEVENFVREGWRLHVPSLSFEQVADYPAARQTMTTLVVPSEDPREEPTVISLAGFGHEGPTAGEETVAKTHPEIFRYSVSENAWSPMPSLPVSRSQLGAFFHNGDLVVMGGLDYDPTRPENDQFRHLTEIVSLTANGTEFQTLEQALPGPRRAFGGAYLNGRYYLIGGMREGFQLVDGCVAFDPAESSFDEVACPQRTRLNPRLVAVGEQLVLVGGTTRLENGELGEDRSIEVYNPATNRWRALETELPFTPKHAQAFDYHGGLLVVSTHNDERRLRLAFIPVAE
ncbi:MAG: hypothetical protein AAGE52_00345 [Myxococcota bacterium]